MGTPGRDDGAIVTAALDDAGLRARLRARFDDHPEAQYELDLAGTVVRANAAFDALFPTTGGATTEPAGRHLAAFLEEADTQRLLDDLPLLADGAARTYEVRGRTDDPHVAWLLVTHVPLLEGTKLIGAAGLVRDVSAERAAHDRLALSESRYRSLFEWSGTGITVADFSGRYLQANPAFCSMVGYDEEELLGRDLRQITHPADLERTSELIGLLIAGDAPSVVFEKRYLTKRGDAVWARVRGSVIRGPDDEPLHLVATVEDITARKEAEARLERSRSLLRIAGRLARVGGWAIDAASRRVEWSDEMFELLEVEAGAVPDLAEGLRRYHLDDRARIAEAVEACLSDGTPFDLEVGTSTFRDRPLTARVRGEARLDVNGRVVEVLGMFQDVSELVAARTRSVEIANRLTTTLESMTDALYIVDRDWHFTYLNARAEQLLERDRQRLLGRVIWDEFPPAADSELADAYRRAMAEQRTVVLDEYHYPPLGRWFEIHAYPSTHALTVYFRDVTEQRHARAALAEREARVAEQAALLDEARDAIMVWDLDGRITYWNRRAGRVYGWSADEATGRAVRELLFDDPDAFDAASGITLREGEWVGELVQRTRDERLLTFEARWTLVRDGDVPRAVMAINTDVTERKRLEEQFLRVQRMESLGTLAGGIAHDLNNVLAPVMMSTELLKADEADPRRHELLQTIETSTRRGAEMIRQVLSFARGVEGLHQHLDAAALLGDVTGMLRETLPRNITVRTDITDEPWSIAGEATQLHQVLVNLAINARDAMPDGGNLRFAVDNVVIDDAYAAMTHGAHPGRHVRITVEDDGTGMPTEVVDRIFEPFFTTKPQGQGTGLGLSTSLAIVTSHGGFVRVYSEPDEGTTFRLYLPAAESGIAAEPIAASPRLPIGNGELVLVVDDEAAVRDVTRQALEAFGYRVLDAADGGEATAIFRERHDAIAAVLTDMMMPVMGGAELIRELTAIDPQVTIVAASGLAGNGLTAAEHANVAAFLSKPYTAEDLITVLRDALDGTG